MTVWLRQCKGSVTIGMEFGIKKCCAVAMSRGKAIKEVEKNGYTYLWILELDKIKEKEMKDQFKREYSRTRVIVD